MAYTDINSEDRLVQQTFADHLEHILGWDSIYAWNQETLALPEPWDEAANATWYWCAIYARRWLS